MTENIGLMARDVQPLIEEGHWITLRGGNLGKDVIHVPVTPIGWRQRQLRFLKIRHRDAAVSKLLTGKPACGRPLAGLKVLKHLHKAIDEKGGFSSAASAEDDDVGFKEDLGVEQNQHPAKRRCRRVRGLDFVAVTVQRTPGQPDGEFQDIIFENSRVLSMDLGEQLENLTWLIKAVMAERAKPDLVSVEIPRV